MLYPKRPQIDIEKSQTAILLKILTLMVVAGSV